MPLVMALPLSVIAVAPSVQPLEAVTVLAVNGAATVMVIAPVVYPQLPVPLKTAL